MTARRLAWLIAAGGALSALIVWGMGGLGAARHGSRPPHQSTAPSSATPGVPSVTIRRSDTSDAVAGEMFGVPVSRQNYEFAKRVALLFSRPWGAADLPPLEREPVIWESLLLHYLAFQRGIQASEEDVERMINELLEGAKRPFTRRSDPEAYRRWVVETLYQDTEVLENQVRYLLQIRTLKNQMLQEQVVSVTDEELRQEFLGEQHHVGGEIVVFDTKEAAQALYERVKDPQQWEQMKASGEHQVRPVSLMTLEAYVDLWSIPRPQIEAFHVLPLGSIGAPMPFGTTWCVYRLLEKRVGDLEKFPAERESYVRQVKRKKQSEALTRRIEELKQSANLKIYP